jgi:uncharacterized protein YcbX
MRDSTGWPGGCVDEDDLMAAELRGIAVHPVKSTAIRHVQRADVRSWGLAGDRRWMVVDGDGVLVTARELHDLFRITADTPETDATTAGLRLSAEGHPSVDVSEPDSGQVSVRLHDHDLLARPAPDDGSRWVRTVLGREDLSLVWCDDPTRRSLNPAYSEPGDHTGFADGYPLTLASLDSLARLDDWIAEEARLRGEDAPAPLPIDRFRPNLVVRGLEEARADRRGHVPQGEARRPVRDDHDLRGGPLDRQGADPHAGAAPAVGRQDLVRGPAHPGEHRVDRGRRPGGRRVGPRA